jgi:hypothetical protein
MGKVHDVTLESNFVARVVGWFGSEVAERKHVYEGLNPL